MANFDPNKLDAGDTGQVPQYDPAKFASFDQAMDVQRPQDAMLHETLMDKAIKGMKDMGAGMGAEFRGEAPVPGEGWMKGAGRSVEKHGPAIAGATALGMATGGAGFVPGVAAAGLGAAGGEGFKQVAEKVRGIITGKDAGPDTSMGATQAMVKQGLNAILGEIGVKAVGGLWHGVKALAPDAAQVMLNLPAQSVKRVLARLGEGKDIIPAMGPEMKAGVERRAVSGLTALQNTIYNMRDAVGSKVEGALNKLHADTGGAKIFNIAKVADNARDMIQQEFQAATDPTVRELFGRELTKINKILDTMGTWKPGLNNAAMKSGGVYRDAKTVNTVKQMLQNLVDYSKGGVPQVATPQGERVLAQMAKDLRLTISETASTIGHKALQTANKEAEDFYKMYDNLRPIIGTKDQLADTLLTKVHQIAGDFNKGGMAKEMIEDIGKISKTAHVHVNGLLDNVAALPFMDYAKQAHHGSIMSVFKTLVRPQTFGKALKQAPKVEALGQVIGTKARALSIMHGPVSDTNVGALLGGKGGGPGSFDKSAGLSPEQIKAGNKRRALIEDAKAKQGQDRASLMAGDRNDPQVDWVLGSRMTLGDKDRR